MKSERKIIKWGIIGLGKIAHKFAQDLLLTEGCELQAVASRTLVKAEKFAKSYDVNTAYGDYESLIKDEHIDAIYIATPHSLHYENTLQCLNYNKAVLCEKPLAINMSKASEMIATAKQKKVLLMEALWTRFLPSFNFVKTKIESGDLGAIKTVVADFGFKPEYNPKHRLFKKSLGGGSLLDIGIYPVFMAISVLGRPNVIKAQATFFETGVDSSVDMDFQYGNNVNAELSSTLLKQTPTTATVHCENGSVMLHSRFHEPSSVTVKTNEKSKTYKFPTNTHGYHYEILHFNQLLREGKIESDLMTYDLSKLLIEILDRVKKEIGLTYTD